MTSYLLPNSLEVNGIEYSIRTDYRVALTIFEALNDPNLDDKFKAYIMLDALYGGIQNLRREDYQEAVNQATWYLDGGKIFDKNKPQKPIMNWEQDSSMIFSAVNKIAGKEIRAEKYMHWWTFLGYFYEIGDGLFSTVILIRQKKAKNKKLDKTEEEFYRANKELVDLKQNLSDEEKSYKDKLNKIFD